MIALAQYLKRHGLTYASLGERIGCSELSVFRYVNGTMMPGRKLMAEIIRETAGEVLPNHFYEQEIRAALGDERAQQIFSGVAPQPKVPETPEAAAGGSLVTPAAAEGGKNSARLPAESPVPDLDHPVRGTLSSIERVDQPSGPQSGKGARLAAAPAIREVA